MACIYRHVCVAFRPFAEDPSVQVYTLNGASHATHMLEQCGLPLAAAVILTYGKPAAMQVHIVALVIHCLFRWPNKPMVVERLNWNIGQQNGLTSRSL